MHQALISAWLLLLCAGAIVALGVLLLILLHLGQGQVEGARRAAHCSASQWLTSGAGCTVCPLEQCTQHPCRQRMHQPAARLWARELLWATLLQPGCSGAVYGSAKHHIVVTSAPAGGEGVIMGLGATCARASTCRRSFMWKLPICSRGQLQSCLEWARSSMQMASRGPPCCAAGGTASACPAGASLTAAMHRQQHAERRLLRRAALPAQPRLQGNSTAATRSGLTSSCTSAMSVSLQMISIIDCT